MCYCWVNNCIRIRAQIAIHVCCWCIDRASVRARFPKTSCIFKPLCVREHVCASVFPTGPARFHSHRKRAPRAPSGDVEHTETGATCNWFFIWLANRKPSKVGALMNESCRHRALTHCTSGLRKYMYIQNTATNGVPTARHIAHTNPHARSVCVNVYTSQVRECEASARAFECRRNDQSPEPTARRSIN